MIIVQFRVDCVPIPKGRARAYRAGSFVRFYTDAKTKGFETLVGEHGRMAMGASRPITAPIDAYLYFEMPIPKSTTKKALLAIQQGKIRHTKKPDLDNLIKSVTDALNKVCYEDDTLIVSIHATKVYSETPGVTIMLTEAKQNE